MITKMQSINKLLFFLSVAAVGLVVVAFVLDATVLSAQHWHKSAQKSNFYVGMARALPELIVPPSSTDPRAAGLRKRLNAMITPDYTESKVVELAQGLEANMRQGAPAPRLDLTDLVAEAQKAQIPASSFNTLLAKPVEINLPAGPKRLFEGVQWLKGWGLIAALMVSVLVALMAGRKGLKRLGHVLLLAGLLPIAIFGMTKLAPQALQGTLTKGDMGVMGHPTAKLIEQVITDTGLVALYAGLALVLVAVVLMICQFALTKHQSNELKPMKTSARPSL